MKLLVFGSLNIDHTYHVPHRVQEGETLSSERYERNIGGKGLNQAAALAKAGQPVDFAGKIGEDGLFLKHYLDLLGVNTTHIQVGDTPTGHAIIQVDTNGSNSIILYGGANQQITPTRIEEVLSHYGNGDFLLMQNEISHGADVIRVARERGMHVVLNPSPINDELLSWPLEWVDWLILNEVEGCSITGASDPDAILDTLLKRWPHIHVVLTLGSNGSVYADANNRCWQEAVHVQAVDTTAAGDTFTGYFLQGILSEKTIATALKTAAHAAAIAVSRPGAGESVPLMQEVKKALAKDA